MGGGTRGKTKGGGGTDRTGWPEKGRRESTKRGGGEQIPENHGGRGKQMKAGRIKWVSALPGLARDGVERQFGPGQNQNRKGKSLPLPLRDLRTSITSTQNKKTR